MRRFLVLAMLASVLVVVPTVAAGADGHLSAACQAANGPGYNDTYTTSDSDGPGALVGFAVGEQLTIKVVSGDPGGAISLVVFGDVNFIEDFDAPYEISYTFAGLPADILTAFWAARSGAVEWEVSCGLADAQLSAACVAANDDAYDGTYAVSSLDGPGTRPLFPFAVGEQLTVTVVDGDPGGAIGMITIFDTPNLFDYDPPYEISYTFAGGEVDRLSAAWFTAGPPVTWNVTCGLADSDGDGVLDGVDVCPDTIADTIAVDDLKKRHYGWYGGEYFTSGGDNDPQISIADTGGCSGDQIIEALGLGKGHQKFGVSLSALRTWIG